VCALNTVPQSRVEQPLPLGLGPRVRFSFSYASSIIDFQVCSPPFALQKPSINLPWSFAAAQKLGLVEAELCKGNPKLRIRKATANGPLDLYIWKLWASDSDCGKAGPNCHKQFHEELVEGKREKTLRSVPYLQTFTTFLYVCVLVCSQIQKHSCELDRYSYGVK
jgi:hypothetical protein